MSVPIISVFNHKGGVGKTTTCIHLAAAFNDLGKRVLLVDADSQCNLTSFLLLNHSTVFGSELSEVENLNLAQVQDDNNRIIGELQESRTTLKFGVSPVFDGRPVGIKGMEPKICSGISEAVGLIPGDVDIGRLETTLALAHNFTDALTNLVNVPGAFYNFIQLTADKFNAEVILVDLPPSLSALSQNLVLASRAVVIPVFPDLFSKLAVESLSSVLPKWFGWLDRARENEYFNEADYKMPDTKPVFGGLVVSKYNVYLGAPAKGFQHWIKKIEDTCKLELLNNNPDFLAPESVILASVPDFNTLGKLAQRYNTATFKLTIDQLNNANQTGVVLTQSVAAQQTICHQYKQAAKSLLKQLGSI